LTIIEKLHRLLGVFAPRPVKKEYFFNGLSKAFHYMTDHAGPRAKVRVFKIVTGTKIA